MTRAGLAPGDIGNVTYEQKKSGVLLAKVRYRRIDGTLGRISRTGPNRQAARRNATAAARERMADVESLDADITADSTLADLARAYLAVQDERNEGNRTQYLNDERTFASKYIIDAEFGRVTLRKLRSSTIAAEHRRIRKVLKKPGRARQYVTLIGKLMAYAVELDALTVNPARDLKMKRTKTPQQFKATDLDVEQLRAVTIAYGDRPNRRGPRPSPLLLDVLDVIAGTGLRLGEALALRWRDVNLEGEAPLVFVTGTVVEGHGVKKFRQDVPKTKDSERGILIPEFLVETLRRRQDDSLGQHELVFETRTGRPVGQHQIRVQLWAVRDWANTRDDQPNINERLAMHALRRGAATRVHRDHDIVVAAQVIGNGQTAVTEQHYVDKQLIRPDVRSSLQAYGRRGG
jgi:integrase